MTIVCSVKLGLSATARRVRARFLRGATLVATVRARLAGGTLTVRAPRARVPKGAYRLVVITWEHGRRMTLEQRVRVA